MKRIIGISVFTIVSFSVWLYVSIFHSAQNEWWTLFQSVESTTTSETVSISLLKLLLGLTGFIVVGMLVSMLFKNRQEGQLN